MRNFKIYYKINPALDEKFFSNNGIIFHNIQVAFLYMFI
jgi:hypothetical protein